MIDAETGLPVGEGVSVLIYKQGPEGCDGEGDDGPVIWNQALTREQGFFAMKLAPGSWCHRARAEGRALGAPLPFTVRANQGTKIEPVARPRSRLQVEIVDEAGQPMPGRVTLVGTHPEVNEPGVLPGAFLFDLVAGERWTPTDFVPDEADDPSTRRYIEQIAYVGASGRAEVAARPGSYEVYVSRGPEYELHRERVELEPGRSVGVAARLERSVSTPGYMSADFHLHARGSIDSGLDYTRRVVSLAGEGVEIVASTDHNYISDYAPFIQAAGLEPFMHSVIGLELSTFEAGHFNAFPLTYDAGSSNRGSFSWQARPPGLIFEELRRRGALSPEQTVVQVNHPRDAILGYFTQHGLDPLTTDVSFAYEDPDAGPIDLLLAPNGRAFYEFDEVTGDARTTFSWNFDALEVINGRRYEIVRHLRASAAELRPGYAEFYRAEVLSEQATYSAAACAESRAADAGGAACETPEACALRAATIASCAEAEAAATPEAERRADAALAPLGGGEAIVCDGGEVAFPGGLDDWYNLLNTERPWGLLPYEAAAIEDTERRERLESVRYRKYTATGNSDSHSAEFDDPGYPRNYVYVGNDDPGEVSDAQIAGAVREHRVVVSNGPFVSLRVNGAPIGAQIEAPAGPVRVELEVRAPRWIDVSRWKLIANGETEAFGGVELEGGIWSTEFEITIDRDTWFVVEIEGDRSMFPILAPAEIPQFDFASALGGLTESFGFGAAPGGITLPTQFQIRPFAFTNPIWVEVGGDGEFNPSGVLARGCDEIIYSPSGLIASPHLPRQRAAALGAPAVPRRRRSPQADRARAQQARRPAALRGVGPLALSAGRRALAIALAATLSAAPLAAHDRTVARWAALQVREGGGDLIVARTEPGERAVALARLSGLALDGSPAPSGSVWARRAADGLEISWYPPLGPPAPDQLRLKKSENALEAALLRSWGEARSGLEPGHVCARVGLRAQPAPEPLELAFRALPPWRLVARSGPRALGPGDEAWACFERERRSEIERTPGRVPTGVGPESAHQEDGSR